MSCFLKKEIFPAFKWGMGEGERRQTQRGLSLKVRGSPPKHEGRQRACAHTCMQTCTRACRRGRGPPPCLGLFWLVTMLYHLVAPIIPHPPQAPSLPVSPCTSLPALRTASPCFIRGVLPLLSTQAAPRSPPMSG